VKVAGSISATAFQNSAEKPAGSKPWALQSLCPLALVRE